MLRIQGGLKGDRERGKSPEERDGTKIAIRRYMVLGTHSTEQCRGMVCTIRIVTVLYHSTASTRPNLTEI